MSILNSLPVKSTLDITPELLNSKPDLIKRETKIFFDWDDTLLASKYLKVKCNHNIKNLSQDLRDKLKELFNKICSLFDLILQYTDEIYIISNSKKDWVRKSANIYLPELFDKYPQIKIISSLYLYA